jgi:hypothetical protein
VNEGDTIADCINRALEGDEEVAAISSLRRPIQGDAHAYSKERIARKAFLGIG